MNMMLRLLGLLDVVGGLTAIASDKLPTQKEDKTVVKEEDYFKFPDLEAKDWKKLENGMKVWDVKEGKGDAVKAGAKVEVHYVGWLTNGKQFDSSKDTGKTITFGLKQVIEGWGQGVPGMKPGGVRRLVIPSELGYGKQGAGGVIPGDATLVFVIELIAVK